MISSEKGAAAVSSLKLPASATRRRRNATLESGKSVRKNYGTREFSGVVPGLNEVFIWRVIH